MTMYEIKSAVLTHPGRKRPHNEDFVAFFEPSDPAELTQSGRLYIVADGVGGEAKGEKASQYAAQKVLFDFYNNPDPDLGARLGRALRNAGNEIHEHVAQSELPRRMATTMVAAVVREDLLTIANVGDSRAYRIRNGQAHQITRDHTIAGELMRNGEVTEEEAMRVKGKHRLTRSLGGERDVHVDLFQEIQLQPGDRILLCSDGLAKYTLSEDIARLSSTGDPEDVVHNWVDFANQRGGSDNITVALIEVGQPLEADVPTVRRGELPTDVDWDAMVTVPLVGESHRPRRRRLDRRQIALLTIAAIAVVAAVGVGILFLAGGQIGISDEGDKTPTFSQEESPLQTEEALKIVEPTASVVGPTPTAQPTPTSQTIIDDSTEVSVDPLPEQTRDPPPISSIPDELAPGVEHWLPGFDACVYFARGDEGLSSNAVLPYLDPDQKEQVFELINQGQVFRLPVGSADWELLGDDLFGGDILWFKFIGDVDDCRNK